MILVTGAAGRIGSAAVGSLLDQGYSVRAGVHQQSLPIDGVETCAIDFDRHETLAPALEGIARLLLISREVEHEEAMVDAAREAGVERIVKLSSFGADTDPFHVGRLHREVERLIEQSGMTWTFLRPNYLMQNFVMLMGDDIRQRDAFDDSIGDARISCVDARDVGAVAARVLTEPGHESTVYELSGPEAISHHEAAGMLSEALGRTIRYVPLDDDEFREKLEGLSVSEEYVEIFVDVNRQTRMGKTQDHVVTPSVEGVLGRPPTPFTQFCRDYASAFAPETGVGD